MGLALKILIFSTVVVMVMAWWRKNVMGRHGSNRPPMFPKNQKTSQKPSQPIASCRYCGVFIPENVAVKGRLGVYCCQVHHDLCEPAQQPTAKR